VNNPRILAALLLAATAFAQPLAQAAERRLGLTQIVEHPSLDAVRKGILDELATHDLSDGHGLRVDFQSAQGNPATAAQIARKFVGEGSDVIVAIATPSAQAVAAATRDIPIVFAAVSDPLAAKLVRDLEHPGGNVTGTSDLTPAAEQIRLIRAVLPQARRIGVLFNPGEANSVALLARFKTEAAAQGFSVVESGAPKSSDVLNAARALVGKVDAIFIPLDNTVVSALEAVIKVGGEAKLPVFSADTDSVTRGTLAAVGFDYYDLGRQSGAQVWRVLQGTAPGEMPVESVEKLSLVLNLKAARAMGGELPPELLARAAKVLH